MQTELGVLLEQGTGNGRARRKAMERAAATLARQTPTSLVEYRSAGRVLIVGPAARCVPTAEQLPAGLEWAVLVTDGTATGASGAGGVQAYGRLARLDGYLGAFTAIAETPAGQANLAGLYPDQRKHFDLVIDLQDDPAVSLAVLPPGYFAVGADETAREAALRELPELVGVFEKPKYYDYDADRCAHGRNGLTGCTRCLDACPTGAITSLGERIAVSAHLCQGLGTCASVCPSGAIHYAYPRMQDQLEYLQELLRAYRDAGGVEPVIVFHDREEGRQWLSETAPDLAGNILPVPVEEVGSVGLETWLSCLVFGAAGVRVLATPRAPATVVRALELQLEIASAIVAAVGRGPDSLALASPKEPAELPATLNRTGSEGVCEASTLMLHDDKRTQMFAALDRLHALSPRPRPLVNLPAGAPFGTADVDANTCTLCLSCVTVCPGHALQDGFDVPQLRFIEANCLQCGMCTHACPENAIWISPRLLLDRDARTRPRVLHEEPPFECIHCGKPFATRRMIENMTAKLRGHPMFQGGALQQLQMCGDCRVKTQMRHAMSPSDDAA